MYGIKHYLSENIPLLSQALRTLTFEEAPRLVKEHHLTRRTRCVSASRLLPLLVPGWPWWRTTATTNANGEVAEGEHMQRPDQHESIRAESRPQPGLRTQRACWWDWCMCFDRGERHHTDLFDGGPRFVKSPLLFLCQRRRASALH